MKEEIEKWEATHLNEERLNIKGNKERQNNKFFTDYDLALEKWNGSEWKVVKNITVVNSNVEVIDFNVNKSGEYRISVKKYGNNITNLIDDILAVTYVKN
ncbi:hypothetical protein [[Mycoplasma] collis]|uniref:hypothetical protein n=1 Tax=[Mycoplasma] collis TaxID=2127 RepID=UPI0006905DAE|nr:hypothetical protein [[Mycoplasma] collis]